jgi:hypothetical protein
MYPCSKELSADVASSGAPSGEAPMSDSSTEISNSRHNTRSRVPKSYKNLSRNYESEMVSSLDFFLSLGSKLGHSKSRRETRAAAQHHEGLIDGLFSTDCRRTCKISNSTRPPSSYLFPVLPHRLLLAIPSKALRAPAARVQAHRLHSLRRHDQSMIVPVYWPKLTTKPTNKQRSTMLIA